MAGNGGDNNVNVARDAERERRKRGSSAAWYAKPTGIGVPSTSVLLSLRPVLTFYFSAIAATQVS